MGGTEQQFCPFPRLQASQNPRRACQNVLKIRNNVGGAKGKEARAENARKRGKRSRSLSSPCERSSKRDKDGERRDKKRRRGKDDDQRWRLEDDEQNKDRQDRLRADEREPDSKPEMHLWFRFQR